MLCWWPRIADGDAHAGRTETSLMLAIAPRLVHLERATTGRTEPLAVLAPSCAGPGCGRSARPECSATRPAASATHGRVLLTRLVVDLIAAVDEWRA